MNYIGIRNFIKSGDVIAFSHSGWKTFSDIESQIVRAFTRSEYSHVGIVLKMSERLFLLEAVVPEIRIVPLSNFNEFYLLSLERPLSEEATDYALQKIGEKYSKWEAIMGFFDKTRNNKSWQCAEYVNSVLKHNNVFIKGKDTPTDIVKGCMEDLGAGLILVQNRRE